MEHGILQNNALDLYERFFEDCDIISAADLEPPTVKVVHSIKYVHVRRYVDPLNFNSYSR